MRARVSLALRAESSGVGSADGKKPKVLSQVVLRAEQFFEDQDALNERQNVRRAEQSLEDQEALNARRRADEQVTISVRLHCAPCTQLVGKMFIYWWPSQVKKAAVYVQTGNLPRVQTLYTAAADNGHPLALNRLGNAYEKGELGVEIDLAAARAFYEEAAEGGDGYAQCRLGLAYKDGDLDLAINVEAARTWCQEAAEGGQTQVAVLA